MTRPQGPQDAESLQLELRGLLREMQCPHLALTMLVDMLSTYENRLLVLDYLLSEVLAARLLSLRQQKQDEMETNGEEVGVV